ncbi:methylaspartate mutase accessory protein GlmL [Chloroflexota bacterium]
MVKEEGDFLSEVNRVNAIQLLIDFGSTFTKVIAVDLSREEIVARAQVPSTVEEDITIGLKEALKKIDAEVNIGNLEKGQALACSSAAGGLRIVCVGFVPEYTSRAATQAALGAGAKVVGCYSYELTQPELDEIKEISPDILLLAGGTDGGDGKVIIHNARMFSRSNITRSHIIVAGNKTAHDEIRSILGAAGKPVTFTKNVMPDVRTLDTEPCNREIREIFIKSIIEAKGIGKARTIVEDIIMPTPSAVLSAAKLLAEGVNGDEGLGEVITVDVGGATTDVHSIAHGNPTRGNVILTGLPEPYVKRTVEGDLGVRYSISTLIEHLRMKGIVLNGSFKQVVEKLSSRDRLPESEEELACDKALASVAVEIAVERHAGKIELVYGPEGEMFIQRGKDLTGVRCVVGTGGPIAFSANAKDVLQGVLFQETSPYVLRPKDPKLYVDEQYMLYAAGLLAQRNPKTALHLMKKYLKEI